ncbi:ATP synthase F0 subunit A [Candidatus Gottesmanbacteria bacterium RIFCSPLOWO2_01_FULL_46_9]|uniref:ATP synthase subunit a n=1 Tax=Candidatus Gottesmanbacteria bacterium RIFCSPLOWO2_01_FULL_46_9 TaxID=1798394 RepID=A0A1F6B2W4_9BACT|nr:MAG: ATP synthase F0 subunit A [Candidatus Gottesmanbacteria bacterium RIFCSPLOWO2_01_FULL_46_9]
MNYYIMPSISLAAEKIGSIAGFSITNSLLATWLVMASLFLFAWAATRNLSLIPSGLQSMAELLVGGLYDFFSSVAGHHIKRFFPLVASIFLFVILANWMGLLPGFGTVGFHHTKKDAVVEKTLSPEITENGNEGPVVGSGTEEKKEETEFVPLLRGATADLNTTLALAIVAVIAIQYFGFRVLGVQYGSKFINFKDPIFFGLGILELISEISRVISFAFRLFGNIFAGEVLLAVMAFLMPFIVPLPFLMMELFVGFIQALVFSMLTAVFLNLAVSHGDEH